MNEYYMVVHSLFTWPPFYYVRPQCDCCLKSGEVGDFRGDLKACHRKCLELNRDAPKDPKVGRCYDAEVRAEHSW